MILPGKVRTGFLSRAGCEILMNQTPTSPPLQSSPSKGREKLYVQDMNLNKLYSKKMGNVKYISL